MRLTGLINKKLGKKEKHRTREVSELENSIWRVIDPDEKGAAEVLINVHLRKLDARVAGSKIEYFMLGSITRWRARNLQYLGKQHSSCQEIKNRIRRLDPPSNNEKSNCSVPIAFFNRKETRSWIRRIDRITCNASDSFVRERHRKRDDGHFGSIDSDR